MPNYPYDDLGTPLDLTNLERLNNNYEQIQADIQSADSASQQRDDNITADYTTKLNVQKSRIDNIRDEITGEVFEQVVDSAKLIWLSPVASVDDLTSTYPTAIEGNAVMVRDTGKVYRFDGSSWLEIQDIDPTAINAVDTRLTAQVEEVSTRPMQDKLETAMVLFIDDDGSTDFLTKLKPIYDANGVKCSLAVNTSAIGTTGFMTLEQLKSLQSEGYEVLNHGKAHQSMDSCVDDAARYEEVVTAQQYLKANGFPSWEHFVLANGTALNKKVESFSFLKRYVKSAVNTGPLSGSSTAVNTVPIEQFSITRQHTPDRTLAQLTAEVDKGLASGGLIVFFTHAQQSVMTPTKVAELDQLIQYVKGLNIPIVSLDTALKTFGNIVDTATGRSGVKISYAGKTNIKEANVIFVPYLAAANFNDSITLFEDETITRAVVASSQSGSSPTPNVSGILVTYKNNSQNAYNYQEWYPNTSDSVYRRKVNTSGVWQAWKTFVPIESLSSAPTILGVGINANTKLVTDYMLNAITIEACSFSNNAGMPNSSSGTLKTHRISDQSIFCYQEYTTITGTLTYKRFGNADNTWKAWVQV